ncbi:hypothetical protein D3C87_256580 [compost metagenome]
MKSWVKFGLFWGAWMTIFMTFIFPYTMVWIGFDEVPEELPIAKIIVSIIVFTITGLFIAYRNEKRKKQPRKQIDN